MIRQSGHALPLLRSRALRQLEASAAPAPLMQRAGAAAAEWAAALCEDRQAPILVVAGPGNNGGDALVAARLLRAEFAVVDVVLAGDAAAMPPDAAAAHAAYLAAGGTTATTVPSRRRWGIVIDGLFGIGLTRDIVGSHAELVATMNAAASMCRCPLLALDCPSGIDSDTGCRRGAAVVATHTLTFLAAKPGLLTGDGPDHCGEIRVAPLAVDVAGVAADDADRGLMIARGLFAAQLTRRQRNSHKGSFGSAGILGGAPGMTGAAILAGRAALHLGAGRVYLGFPGGLPADFDPVQPELMWRDAPALFAAPLTALCCGPGLGTDAGAAELLAQAVATDIPLLLDADALNLLASDEAARVELASRTAATVLTPHPAEAARLLVTSSAAIQADRIGAAREIAAQYRTHVVLKGCGTLVAAPDGRWWLNASGTPGLATAGSGDVLAGLLVALLAQGWPIDLASFAAVHLHGRASEQLSDAIGGEVGNTASEIAVTARAIFNRWIADAAA